MYDIPELEKKWRKYKRNQIKKPLLFGLATLLLVGGAAIVATTYFNVPKKEVAANNNTTVAPTPQPKPQQQAIVITKVPATPPVAQQNTTQNPLIAAKPAQPEAEPEQTIDLSKATIIKPDLPKDDIRVIGFDNNEKKDVKTPDIVIPQKSVHEIAEEERIAEIEDRFRATQDPKDSLYIAKYYYKKGQYKKAENWAVNTNNIDGDIEESWLIFAKARAKQGFRVDAIKVLQSYYDETNSVKAKELLDKLRFGKPIN